MKNFWVGFEKQAGWKKNLAIAGGIGAAGAGLYGLKRRGDEKMKDLKSKVPADNAKWNKVVKNRGGIMDDVDRVEADMDYREMGGKYK